MKRFLTIGLAAAVATAAALPFAKPAQADTTSTVAIMAAAAAVVGVILTDSNNQSYYVNNGRHVYISRNAANYYRAHGNQRNHMRPQGAMQMHGHQQMQQQQQQQRPHDMGPGH